MTFTRVPAAIIVAALLAMLLAAPALAYQVTQRGNPLQLAGEPPAVGAAAPDFTALDNDFKPVSLSDFKGKTVLISAVPSLATKVCTLQTKRFDEELAKLPPDVVVMTISMDLPFAQKDFCGREDIKGMVVVSDSARREFGERWGVLIPARGLLARSVFVVGPDGIIRYEQIVPELTDQPDYDAALAALRAVEAAR